MLPDGVFPCVALSSGVGTWAIREGDPRAAGAILVQRFPIANPADMRVIERFPLPAGSPAFPNLYILDAITWLAYHDGAQQVLRNLANGAAIGVAGALSNPSAFGGEWFAYTEGAQPYRVHRYNLRSAQRDQPRLGAPTGLSRITDDGRVVTIDEDRFTLAGATIPSFAGPLGVGEGLEGGVFWAHAAGARGTLYKPAESFTPKCATDGGETLAITTAGTQAGSTRLFCGTLAALLEASGQPDKQPGPIEHDRPIITTAKEHTMAAEEIGAIKVGPLFGRVVEAFAGHGPFGWYEVRFDRETPDDDCWWTLTKPDARHAIIHTKIPCLLGADQLKAEDSIFYGKPTNLPNARGILESPVLIKDPASDLIVGYFTWPERHPTGGTSSPSFTWIRKAA